MYRITINSGEGFAADLKLIDDVFSGTLNDIPVAGDLLRINAHQYHMLYKGRSYNIDVVKLNAEEKSITLRINAVRYSLQLKDKYDELLHSLGLDDLADRKVNDIKAPMPGMVLKMLVNEGDAVKKGDGLLVLEAMKMENIIKSPADGVVKKISAVQGTAVEKNQLLIQF